MPVKGKIEMKDAITAVPGIRVGHAQDIEAGTGCTVVICEQGAVAAVDIRGGAPGTRETDCLDPVNLVSRAHAVYLGGGSAFGLDAAAGVMKYLEEKKIGFDVGVTRVPIVPGAVIFDLQVGNPFVRPDGKMGYEACLNAGENNTEQGNVGAGTGATVGRAAGESCLMKGGLGTACNRAGDLVVGAIVVVSCFGDVIEPKTGEIIAGTLTPDRKGFADSLKIITGHPDKKSFSFSGNTTIGVIATNAGLSKAGAKKVAMMSHDGYGRAVNPAHTMFDGDTIFCMSAGNLESDLSAIGAMAAEVMARAIVNAVKNADSLYGIPAYKDLRK